MNYCNCPNCKTENCPAGEDVIQLERERDDARKEAVRWQEAWMNNTPLHEIGSTVMPWMQGWQKCKSNTSMTCREQKEEG